jgi:hypothetical protein
MKSLYQAYEAYERKVMRGETGGSLQETTRQLEVREPLLAQIGEMLIQAGLRLKRRHIAGKPIAWSTVTGSKP